MQRMRDDALIRTLKPRGVPESPEQPPPGSNHVTVVDADGNIATLLHSCLSDAFGNGLWAAASMSAAPACTSCV